MIRGQVLDGRFSDNRSENGRLRVAVFDVNVGTPLPNAKITVIEQQNASTVEQLTTNSSGVSETVSLICPPLEYSQRPGMPQPYEEYTVQVEAEGFENAQIDGVQIFDDTLALQNINLVPLAKEQNQELVIQIPEHTLWGVFPPKIPEDAIKELPPESGFVVLDKPVVPEIIVVHNGDPNNPAAQNFYVPFRDYIKNVASCEIYDTWPEQTLRANILAIISFTLNRVFTEWYRNKGKNFTITNSTAYDQAFVYGRNIFTNISRVVDEIFTSYITKPGIRQPLFTQYCDGQRSACPGWMQQWGSKTLGDQGFDDISILRNYYGDAIFLAQAEKVTGVPSSYPGKVLNQGSTGQDVRTIQTQLNAISNNYPAIPKLKVDGAYGAGTAEAVKVFQGIFNMPQSGVVDFPTWYKISEIYVAVERLAELI